MKTKKRLPAGQLALHIFFIALSLCYILPMILTISISFEGKPSQFFSLLPKEFSTEAYGMVFAKPTKIIKAYGVTAFSSIVATVGQLAVVSMYAYAISKRDYIFRNGLTFLAFFATLFSGGLVPSYIINTKYLHLYDSLWVYVVPALFSAWNVIVVRTFIQGLPNEMFEAARIDGATEFQSFTRIALPLSTPALASVGFLNFIAKWNEWQTSQIYIRDPDKYQLQYLLKIILDSEQVLQEMAQSGQAVLGDSELANLEAMRYAMAIIAAGPACLIFPLFQKYFAKGMTLGAVKG